MGVWVWVYDSIVCSGVEEVRMSLPSRGHNTSRPPLTSSTFQSDRKSPSRSQSLSSSEYMCVAVYIVPSSEYMCVAVYIVPSSEYMCVAVYI